MIVEASKRELKQDIRKICKEQLVQVTNVNVNSHQVLKYIKFGDVLDEGISADDRIYDEINDSEKLLKRV